MFMKTKSFFVALALSLIATSLSAQDNNNPQRGQRRQKMDTTEMFNRQAERLVKQLKLEDEKKDVFTVLYLDYQAARQNATHPKGEDDSDERIDIKKLTDEQATQLIEKQFAQTEAQLTVDKEYYKKFLEILTPSQTAQIFIRQRAGNRAGNMQGGQRPGGGRGQGGQGGFGGGFGGPGGDF